ncbi:MAG TPA: FAD-dependent oxidoreductase [Spirochaetota bacterium]|nr:FAD-dependent oxidoreductase [Spirochaetota bacterium]HPI90631.1 FAD-dependent oxidoreductase [Spirochaetota bacterium]HPR46873.1 FAD-dependent oxidoreductase [Spirochaetota bacterium]
MEHYNIIVLGGDAAGMSAASQARRTSSSISVAVFEKGPHVSYAACGMPYYISGEISNHMSLIAIDKNDFTNKRNINIFTETEVTAADFEQKTVTALCENRTCQYSYDTLIIATGARAVVPPIPGIDGKNIFFLRNLSQGIAVREFIEAQKPEKGIIIGGGFIGLEMAESLRRRNISTTIIEMMPSLAMTMSPEIREKIKEELEKNNVQIHTETPVTGIEDRGDVLVVNSTDTSFEADFIIVSVGIIPNTEFLKGSALSMTPKGAILVDETSRTNIPDVFAAGDCATVRHLVLDDDFYMPLGSTANKQGRVAGLQAAGKTSERFKGIIGSQFVKIFELEVGKTGLNREDAGRYGIPAESLHTLWKSRAGYYPGSEIILVVLTINTETRVVIGGEFAGQQGAALRTNTVAAAIAGKMTIDDLAYLDLGYAPPFSPVWDPVNAAAQKFLRRR